MTAAAELTPSGAPRARRRLVDIVNDLLTLIDEAEGEVTDMIDALDLELEDKVEACHVVIQHKKAQAEGFAKLEKSYKARKATCEKAAEDLKERVALQLAKAGVDKLQAQTCTAYFQSSESVVIADEEKFLATAEDRFVKVTQSPKLAEVKKAIDAGELVDGAEVKTSRSLRFK